MSEIGSVMTSLFDLFWSVFDSIELPFFFGLKLSTIYIGFFVAVLSIGFINLVFGLGSELGSSFGKVEKKTR